MSDLATAIRKQIALWRRERYTMPSLWHDALNEIDRIVDEYDPFPDGPGAAEAIEFQRQHSPSADAPKFAAGDRVCFGVSRNAMGTIEKVALAYWVRGDVGSVVGDPETLYGGYSEDEIESAPELPDDHIDRHWIVGAWIVQHWEGAKDLHWIVVDEEHAICGKLASAGSAFGYMSAERAGFNRDHGYGFHPDSPIQTKREP